ncbi:TlpA family protein disulfide reductase [Myxococcota bacterium]|nr:TlpA family protein disulfide reductase [Myxococcota bacterium]
MARAQPPSRASRRALVLPIVVALSSACLETSLGPKTGDVLPAFEGTRLDGAKVALPAEAKGKVVVLHFWSTECPYCVKELVGVEATWKALHDRGIAVYASNVGEKRAVAEALVADFGFSFPVVLDEDQVIARRFGVLALPTTYLVDRTGVIRRKILGEVDAARFRAEVEALVDGKKEP